MRAGTEWWDFRREVDPGNSETHFRAKGLLEKEDGIWRITEAGKKAVEEMT